MPRDVRKARVGDKVLDHLTANAFNQFADAATLEESPPSSIVDDFQLFGSVVWVENASNYHVAKYDVLGIGAHLVKPSSTTPEALLSEFKAKPLFSADTPTYSASHFGRVAVLLKDAPPGKIAPALVSGATAVQINVGDVTHRYADVSEGSTTYLASRDEGCAVIKSQLTETGIQWCLVQLGGSDPIQEAVFFHNNSGEEIPPYAVLEIEQFTAGGYYEVIKPSSRRDAGLWAVNGALPVGIDKYGVGNWAVRPTRVMVNGTHDPQPTFYAPEVGEWFLNNDSSIGAAINGFGFRWASFYKDDGTFGGGTYIFNQNSLPTYTFDYPAGYANLKWGVFKQVDEPSELSRNVTLSAANNSGWTSSSSLTLNTASPTGYLSCADSTTPGNRVGFQGVGSADPVTDGALVMKRTGYYRFLLSMTFTLSASAGDFAWPTKTYTTSTDVDHVVSDYTGNTLTTTGHHHTVDVANYQTLAMGAILTVKPVVNGSVGSIIFQEQFPIVAPSGSRAHRRLFLWESRLEFDDLITFQVNISDTWSKHSVAIGCGCVVVRVRDVQIQD